MPAIRRRREKALRRDCRPDSSRHIACPPNKQLPREQQPGWLNVRRAADEDSAAQMERDGERILRECPCALQTRWRRRRFFILIRAAYSNVKAVSRFPNCRHC